MRGVAGDHPGNPIKIEMERLKRHGAKVVSVNPVRTGYSAVADEWVPIRPGTDGLLAMAIAHVLLSRALSVWGFRCLLYPSDAPDYLVRLELRGLVVSFTKTHEHIHVTDRETVDQKTTQG